jgi:hypothetical protein
MFVFAIFLLISIAGCAAANTPDNTSGIRQGYTGNTQAGQGGQSFAGAGERKSEWPGDTVNNNAMNGAGITGGSAISARTAGNAANSDAGNNAANNAGFYTTGNTANRVITLLNIKTPVKRGGTARLSIQGQPGVRYTASSVYNKSGKTFTSAVEKTAGTNGVANWTWTIGGDTVPGTYNITVTGGGNAFSTTYTVE